MLRVNPSLKKYVDDLVAASIAAIHPAKIKTGSYIGNSTDDRDIDIGVDLAAKTHKWVIIKDTETEMGIHRPSSLAGNATMFFANESNKTDKIKAFTNTGFRIGAGTYVNNDERIYHWIAIWEE